MSCTDSLATPVKKTRNQLLYLIYGNQDVYRREAKFSILTALSHVKKGEPPCIRVLTDRPQDYAGWPVETVLLTEETLTLWQGGNGYHHRRKACAMAAGLALAEKTLFVDTDTLFLSDPSLIFNQIEPGHYLMDRLEYNWRDVCERHDYLKLGEQLRPHGITPDNGFKLYNSGLCGVTERDAPLFETSIQLIDEWTRGSFDIHTIEQIALSFAMRDKPVREAKKYVYHYFAEKRFFHAMQAYFFSQHGEQFSQNLVELCRDVPRVKPVPSAWQRLKIKWKLRKQSGAMRKVGRDLLYGSAAPDHPYYTACRHEWWESASREILRWNHTRQKQLLGTHQTDWPQQLPKPEKPEDEQIIMKYLRKRIAAAR
ncbi:hypothetical protein PSH97_08735 [Pseudomonas cucumis]|uniref:Nucleotide-diphospho-sugar transferase domain-containing protein n=1 Tax=Pseudomonas cucumis TaxID=2954082 RepID=A0ABY9F1T1_9PSED|nr:hypothetical protein [Pseudomonas cucumis]WLG86591.1 hypothetical protein PSH97_08735 [Pseudomonas cucumis]